MSGQEIQLKRRTCLSVKHDPEINAGLRHPTRIKVVSDELTYLVNRRRRYQRGISCPDCNDYDLEAAASRVQCPSLCINGEMALRQLDRQKLAGTQRSDTACRLLPQMELTALSGVRSGLHMIQTSPKELASVCLTFLEKHEL